MKMEQSNESQERERLQNMQIQNLRKWRKQVERSTTETEMRMKEEIWKHHRSDSLHGVVGGLIYHNFDLILLWSIRISQVSHLHVRTPMDGSNRHRETGGSVFNRLTWSRINMHKLNKKGKIVKKERESIPWRKKVMLWKNSGHPSVRIKHKISFTDETTRASRSRLGKEQQRHTHLIKKHFAPKKDHLSC